MDINYVQKIQELVVLLHTIKRNFYLVFNLWIRKNYENGGLMDILNVFANNNSNVSSYIYNIFIIICNYVTAYSKKKWYNILEDHGFITFFNEIKILIPELVEGFDQTKRHNINQELTILSHDIVKDINNCLIKNMKIDLKKYLIFKLEIRKKKKIISKIKIYETDGNNINGQIVNKKATAEDKLKKRKELTDIKILVHKFVYDNIDDNKDEVRL